MLSYIWNTVLYQPLLNALAFLVSVVPGQDVGLAVVLLTLLVKIILSPVSSASIKSQVKMNLLSPELNKIKKSGLNKEEQAKKTFELYKKHKTNPFSGCLLVLVQIPIIFALYYVFYKGINFESGLLYSFVSTPSHVNMKFLGLLDVGQKSLILAILTGLSQFFQAYFMPKPSLSKNDSSKGSFQESFAKSIQMQTKYFFPFIVAFIAYRISGAVALYWVTSNLFTIGQQIYLKKKNSKKEDVIIEVIEK